MSSNDEDQIREILKRAKGTEHPDIEFKSQLVLKSAAQKAEFAKDVALQANLPAGGNILCGFDDTGYPIGLSSTPNADDIARVLSNRLMFAPSGIDVREIALHDDSGKLVKVLWIRVGVNGSIMPTAFLEASGTWKVPIRVGTVTRYLSSIEVLAYSKAREETKTALTTRYLPEQYGSEADNVDEILESNLFPFTNVPKLLWVARTVATNDREVISNSTQTLPPFRLWNGQIFCLRDYNDSEDYFSPVISSSGKMVTTREFLSQRGSRRVIIGLLNKEVVSYAMSIGLFPESETESSLDAEKTDTKTMYLSYDEEGGKLFFPRFSDRPTKIRWKSFQRQGVRTVVGQWSRTDGSIHHWYHFASRLWTEDLGRAFALCIDPTWYFTRDGTNPLPPYRVGRVAGARISREDNARILYNTRFWIELLSKGERNVTLPLGGGGATISKEPILVHLKRGISNDVVEVTEQSIDMDVEAEEILPVEEYKDSGGY